jgi:hypothetical protein
MSRIRISLITIAGLFACAAPDHTTGPSLASGGQKAVSRPLSGRCTTVVSRLAPPPIETQRIEYTCRISHLGLTHAVVTQTVNTVSGALSNSGVYVAANGDQLSSSFSGNAVLSFTDPADASVTFNGTQEFSAGTGRFADAEGEADLVGSAHINLITGDGTGEFTLDGGLTY